MKQVNKTTKFAFLLGVLLLSFNKTYAFPIEPENIGVESINSVTNEILNRGIKVLAGFCKEYSSYFPLSKSENGTGDVSAILQELKGKTNQKEESKENKRDTISVLKATNEDKKWLTERNQLAMKLGRSIINDN